MKKFFISLIGSNPWHSPYLGLISDIPYSHEFSKWPSYYADQHVNELKKILNDEKECLVWDTDKVRGKSYKKRSKLKPDDLEGDVVIRFKTKYLLEVLQDWVKFYDKYFKQKEPQLYAFSKAFTAAKAFDFTWTFMYHDFRYEFTDPDLNLNIEVMIRITPKDLELSVEEFLSIINVGFN
jgi:hypothetical protein